MQGRKGKKRNLFASHFWKEEKDSLSAKGKGFLYTFFCIIWEASITPKFNTIPFIIKEAKLYSIAYFLKN